MKTGISIFIFLFSGLAHGQFRPLTRQVSVKRDQVYTANSSFSVPAGVKKLFIKVWGAGGGGGGAGYNGTTFIPGGTGGTGGFSSAVVEVSTSDSVAIFFGGAGVKGPRYNNAGFGGTGGGETYVSINSTKIISVGGAGGGGGGDLISAQGGNGGNGGSLTADNGYIGIGTTQGNGGAIDPATNLGTPGSITTMPSCPAGATTKIPPTNGNTGNGGICSNGASTVYFAANSSGLGGARSSATSPGRPSGGGGGVGAFGGGGGGGQGVMSPAGTAGAGAGGGGGAAFVNTLDFSDVTQERNLKVLPGVSQPPANQDGDFIVGTGAPGQGADMTGPAGGNGGPGLVVIYFLYN